jgi:hypothetical protein
MALRLVIGACSNEYVASWALQRMDDDLVRRTRREAAYLGKPSGRFVAEIVRDFERTSDFAARANAARSIRASDQPLLAGLRFILGHRAGWRIKAR